MKKFEGIRCLHFAHQSVTFIGTVTLKRAERTINPQRNRTTEERCAIQLLITSELAPQKIQRVLQKICRVLQSVANFLQYLQIFFAALCRYTCWKWLDNGQDKLPLVDFSLSPTITRVDTPKITLLLRGKIGCQMEENSEKRFGSRQPPVFWTWAPLAVARLVSPNRYSLITWKNCL